MRRLVWLLVAIVVVACGAPAATVAPALPTARVVMVTFTPPPTATPSPTATLAPTETLAPTAPATEPPPVGGQGAAPAPAAVQPAAAPPAAVAPLVAAPASSEAAAAEQYMVELINAQRQANGLAPLGRNETLMGVARARVADMVARNYAGHYDPVTGASLGRPAMRAAGFTSNYLGENWYGSGRPLPGAVDVAMNWFMSDAAHRDNILHPSYAYIGVGIAYNGQLWLMVQNFAGN